jgi:hypothetical protein
MCGIVGIVHKNPGKFSYPDLDMFKEMLVCDAIRGPDSTGVFSVNRYGNAKSVKIASHPHNLIRSKEFETWSTDAFQQGQILVGHNRKATEGNIKNANAHPFQFGHIMLVHNGQIDNWRSLVPIHERERHSIEVDSHAAAVMFARKDPIEMLEQMHGAFVFIWYDVNKKELSFISNGERPLSFAESDDQVIFASEYPMLEWILDRRGVKHEIKPIKANQLLVVNVSGEAASWTTKEIKLWIPRSREVIYTEPTMRLRAVKTTDIPSNEQFNIHYGGNYINSLINDNDFIQIIWEMEDFKELSNAKDIVNLWGKALNSTNISVRTHFRSASTEELAAFVDAKYLMSHVRKVKAHYNSETKETDYTVHVGKPKIVEMKEVGTGNNLTLITKEQYDHIIKTSTCGCREAVDETRDTITLVQRMDKSVHRWDMFCQYCIEDDFSKKNKDENSQNISV